MIALAGASRRNGCPQDFRYPYTLSCVALQGKKYEPPVCLEKSLNPLRSGEFPATSSPSASDKERQRCQRSSFEAFFYVESVEMRVKNWLLYTIVFGCCLCATAFGQQAIQWQPTLDMAKQIAGQTHRLVLVHFWSPSCEPCRRMERDVFPHPQVVAAVETSYTAVKLNADHFPATARQFGVSALPTDIVISPDGQLIDRSVGSVSADKYVGMLNRIAATVKQSPSANYAQSPAPHPSQTLPHSPGIYAPGPPGYPSHVSATNPPNGGVSSPQAPSYAVQAVNPGGPPARQDLASPPFASASVNTQSGANQIGGLYQNQAGAQNQPVVPPPAAAPALPGFDPAPPPAVANAPQGPPQIANGNPTLGMDGYCPVQLSEKERWVKGNPQWGIIHRGRTYLFAGPEEQSRFYADPDRYAPAYAGSDIVVAVEQGVEANGLREHGAWFDGRVYLFASEQSYERFSADPYGYVRRMQQMAASSHRTLGVPTGRY